MSSALRPLFEPDVPPGFRYAADFLTTDDEQQLLDQIARVGFSTFEMRGVVAKRRVAFFGASYDAATIQNPEIPPFLLPLRERLAVWAGRRSEEFAMALINDYPPGAPIGWHRDAPQYDIVVGLSLLSSCRMKFRPYLPPAAAARVTGRRTATHEMTLEPRSGYLIAGDARTGFEHHIPAVSRQRYSITFRTLR